MTLRLSCGDNIIAKWLKYNAIGQILSRFENLIPNPTQRKKKKKKKDGFEEIIRFLCINMRSI
jgi:hypothetical protein